MAMRESLLLCVLSASLALPALACGPDFPSTLLADRGAALLELPEGSFDAEASRLVPPPQPAFTVVDRGAWLWGPEPVTQVAVERGWLGDAYERVRLMRDQSSAAAAEARGEELPEEARQYTAGAVAFAGSDYAEARRRFERVLALPAPQQNRYGPLAQYSLARSLLLQEKPDVAAAAAAFHAVRADQPARARQGIIICCDHPAFATVHVLCGIETEASSPKAPCWLAVIRCADGLGRVLNDLQ